MKHWRDAAWLCALTYPELHLHRDHHRSNVVTSTVNVTSVNDLPNTNAGSGSGLEDAASIAVSLSGTDVDGSVTSFRIIGAPANGILYADAALTVVLAATDTVAATGNAATVYFVPNGNFSGVPTFQYAAIDNSTGQDASPATATITVTSVNDIPSDIVFTGNASLAASGTTTTTTGQNALFFTLSTVDDSAGFTYTFNGNPTNVQSVGGTNETFNMGSSNGEVRSNNAGTGTFSYTSAQQITFSTSQPRSVDNGSPSQQRLETVTLWLGMNSATGDALGLRRSPPIR